MFSTIRHLRSVIAILLVTVFVVMDADKDLENQEEFCSTESKENCDSGSGSPLSRNLPNRGDLMALDSLEEDWVDVEKLIFIESSGNHRRSISLTHSWTC